VRPSRGAQDRAAEILVAYLKATPAKSPEAGRRIPSLLHRRPLAAILE
jgi:hypothetical protein